MENIQVIGTLWILLSFVFALAGDNKNIGYWPTFFLCLILSPLIGLFIALFSAPKQKTIDKYKEYEELAKREEYKGNIDVAIDNYLNSLYHLENDYGNLYKDSQEEKQRLALVDKLKSKVDELKNLHVTR